MRFFTPFFLFAVAGYVWYHNSTSTGSILLFPFIEYIIPSTKGDPATQGAYSAYLFGGLGVLFSLRALRSLVRERGQRDTEE